MYVNAEFDISEDDICSVVENSGMFVEQNSHDFVSEGDYNFDDFVDVDDVRNILEEEDVLCRGMVDDVVEEAVNRILESKITDMVRNNLAYALDQVAEAARPHLLGNLRKVAEQGAPEPEEAILVVTPEDAADE